MKIVIDKQSGFCFGVVRAIEMAENIVNNNEELYCLGEIVHNNEEVERLQNDGMKTIESTDIENIKNKSVLIRAHGEPPQTYETLKKNNNTIHDATCPVVLKLQQRVKKGFEEMEKIDGQVLIFGKKGHAEVNGLVGQTKGKATVIESIEDIKDIDFSKPTRLFAQTTKSIEEFKKLVKQIDELTKEKQGENQNYKAFDTICRQVANRKPQLINFSKQHDVIIFVSGKKSSNGQYLYNVCKETNPRTFFISSEKEIDFNWFDTNTNSIGICGATSTPMWLMEKVAKHIDKDF